MPFHPTLHGPRAGYEDLIQHSRKALPCRIWQLLIKSRKCLKDFQGKKKRGKWHSYLCKIGNSLLIGKRIPGREEKLIDWEPSQQHSSYRQLPPCSKKHKLHQRECKSSMLGSRNHLQSVQLLHPADSKRPQRLFTVTIFTSLPPRLPSPRPNQTSVPTLARQWTFSQVTCKLHITKCNGHSSEFMQKQGFSIH